MYAIMMLKNRCAFGLITALISFGSIASGAVVVDWQFNTIGDVEGWTDISNYSVNNLKVANAVSGSEVVLTSDNLKNTTDTKLNSPTGTVTLSDDATAWETYTIRIRHLGTDGVTPVAFDTAGTIAMITGGLDTFNPIHDTTTPGYKAPVTVVNQANHWNLVTYDISGYSADFGKYRLDPITGFDAGGGTIQGNFEIDYITITDNAVIPEPGSVMLLLVGGLAFIGLKRRQ